MPQHIDDPGGDAGLAHLIVWLITHRDLLFWTEVLQCRWIPESKNNIVLRYNVEWRKERETCIALSISWSVCNDSAGAKRIKL
jgi:hypothetical protein